MLLLFATLSYGKETSNDSNYQVILTTDPAIKRDIDSFDCSDKIYITADLKNISMEKHSLKAIWINPSKETEQVAEHEFQTGDGTYYGWLWLKLSPPTGGAILGALSPNSGMAEYIGIWNVHLYLDNKKLDSKVFQISC